MAATKKAIKPANVVKKKVNPIKPQGQAVIEIVFADSNQNPVEGSIKIMTGSNPAYRTLQEWFSYGWRITSMVPTVTSTSNPGTHRRSVIAILTLNI